MSFGMQVRKRRQILRLTLQEVANRLSAAGTPITRAALSKYETGKSLPRPAVLRALTKALECSVDYLLNPPRTQIEWVRFRKKTGLRAQTQLEVQETARQWLEARLCVSEALGLAQIRYDLGTTPIKQIEQTEQVAERVRDTWGVGQWPIGSITSAMERSGIAVIALQGDYDLNGISGTANDDRRLVVVSSSVPVDRMRMTLAHELGHFVVRPTADESFDEQAASRFAASLLMPADVLRSRVGKRRSRIDLRELFLLKEEYGMSVQALIRRCLDLSIITDWTYRQLNSRLRSIGWHGDEPGICSHREGLTETRSYLLRCTAEGILPEERIHSMFPDVANEIDRLESEAQWDWRDLRSRPEGERQRIIRRAADLASEDYQEGGSLHGLELIDDGA
jgi:Zn-dependent peptidase ImmA (M78 family)/transcriptional regulator with XRE-family HTH domain